MKKSLRNILIISSVIVALGILFFPSECLQAQSLIVDFQTIPLFNETNFLPGESVTREVKVTNDSGQIQKIATQAVDYPGYSDPGLVPTDDLSRALIIVIREKGGGDLYGGTTGAKTLFNFYEAGEVYLSDIASGNFEEYEYEISFPSDKGDEWQGKTTSFDIEIGFQIEEEQGGEEQDQEIQGGIAGFFPSGLFIFNEENETAETEIAVVSWFTNTPATSRVIYDTAAHPVFLGSPPNYGYVFSTIEDPAKVTFHTVTITGLTPGVTYFWRAVSHGSPETLGNELAFGTIALPKIPPAEEFMGGIELQEQENGWTGEWEPGPIVFAESSQEQAEENPPAGGEEEVIEENVSENIPEENPPAGGEETVVLPEPVVSKNPFTLLLADIGDIIGNIFGYPCMDWKILLVLIIYSLVKAFRCWQEYKKELKVWLIWSAALVFLAICFYFEFFGCLSVWIFIILGIATFFIRWFFSQEQ